MIFQWLQSMKVKLQQRLCYCLFCFVIVWTRTNHLASSGFEAILDHSVVSSLLISNPTSLYSVRAKGFYEGTIKPFLFSFRMEKQIEPDRTIMLIEVEQMTVEEYMGKDTDCAIRYKEY